ncbi:sulfotransferase ssu-1-like [Dermacentor variabilis]|uniref:sulfotransferase ssu-1-like n=1 Tax=Dermacentor variabilis TaxID=34621 RepID=UPI003F5AF795
MKRVPYKYVDGYCCNTFFNDDLVRSALNYKPEPGDVFIATYPKCGTTWVQYIVYGIFNRGTFPKDPLEFMLASPFLEMLGAEAAQKMPRPGTIKTHMPFGKVPYSEQAKYITIARNPFDVCVSFYYHTKEKPSYDVPDMTFDDYFENFVRGTVSFGDYFDHLLSWYGHRNDPNVLFLTYEELKMDARTQILKIADFLGTDYGNMLRNNDELMKKLLDGSEFKNMQVNVDSGGSILHRLLELPPERALKSLEVFREPLSKSTASKGQVRFLRKGIVGDWRNHFSEEQVDRMKKRIVEKCANTDVMKLWEGIGLPLH